MMSSGGHDEVMQVFEIFRILCQNRGPWAWMA
jgi:hypothetical protein